MNYLWSSGIYCKQGLQRQFGRSAISHERVILALLRLSRDRYLSGDYVMKCAMNLARCINGRHWLITKKVFDDEDMYRSNHVGLMRGVVPFQGGGLEFYVLLEMQTRISNKKNIELKILNLILKGMRNGN